MSVKKYIRKEEFVEAIKFTGKNCIECIMFADPDISEKSATLIAHARSIYESGKFKYLLVGKNRDIVQVGDFIVRSKIGGISVIEKEKFEQLFLPGDYYL